MAEFDQTQYLRIQNIVEKLEKLDCSLVGNKEDEWIMELLFKPGFHRYQLIEWILSKFGFDIEKMVGLQVSTEEMEKNLQSAVSDLGICTENCQDVIKGIAAKKQQLEFWCTLVDILWLKHEITMNTSAAESGIVVSPEEKYLEEEFEHNLFGIRKICEVSNIKCLFEPNFQLLDPDVEREIKNMSPTKFDTGKISSLQDFKDMAKELASDPLSLLNNLTLEEKEFEEDTMFGEELNKSEENLQNVSADFLNSIQADFEVTYKDLKSIISQMKGEQFTDVGEYFKTLEPYLESFSQLKNSFPELQSSDLKLSQINSNLDLLSQESLADGEKLRSLMEDN